MSTAAASDPFGSTANPAHYVPRPATERALEALQRGILQGNPMALTGPTGLGKTLLLSVLGERLATGFRVVGLPYPALSGAELCRWVLDALGEPAGDDPEGALLDCGFRAAAEGREILLLVDDASALPPGTARSLSTLLAASGSALRAVFAAGDDARTGPALAALGQGIQEVRLEDPLTAEETARYVRSQLERAGTGEAERTARFQADTLARLHGASGGIPRRIHELGALVWRAPEGADLPALIERWAREDAGRDGEGIADEIEIDEAGAPPPVLELDAAPEETQEPEASFAPLARPTEGAGDPPEEDATPALPPGVDLAPVAERRRPRGAGVALLALAGLAIGLVYAMPRLESWLEPAAPRRPPARVAPVEPPEAPAAVLEPEYEAELAPPLLPDEGPAAEPEPEEIAESSVPVPASEDEAAPIAEGSALAEVPAAAAVAPSEKPEREPEPAPKAPAIVPAVRPRPEPAPPAQPVRAVPRPILVNVEAIPFAQIYVDGGVVGETPLEVPLSPGLHVFRAEFDGGRAIVRAVEISAEHHQLLFE